MPTKTPSPHRAPWETIYPPGHYRFAQDNFPLGDDDVEVAVDGDGNEDPELAELQTVALEPVAPIAEDEPTRVPGMEQPVESVDPEDVDTEFPDDPPAMLHQSGRKAPAHKRAPWFTIGPDDNVRVDPTGRPIIG